MGLPEHPSQSPAYRCPGQLAPISRAVHLGRLAAFYPACRTCCHRDDTGTLSPRQIEQLQEVVAAGSPRALFHDEGAGGVYRNELTPGAARQIAAAFAAMMRNEGLGIRDWGLEEAGRRKEAGGMEVSNPQSPIPNPSVLLAGDGRPITAEVSAAVGEGLRFGGCNVIDIGPATAACLAFAVHHLQATGGILVGNPGQQPHLVGLQFWAAGPRPLSAGGSLEPLAERFWSSGSPEPLAERSLSGINRPARQCGGLQREQADEPYLSSLSQQYHALRPLRLVVDSASRPMADYLRRLAAKVVCEVIPCRATRHDLPEQVRADSAHFAACIDGDGETCHVLDEQGREVPAERVLLLLARQLLRTATTGRGFASHQTPAVVLEELTPVAVARGIEQMGARVVANSARRAAMAAAMSEPAAVLGGGPSGRFWHCDSGIPLPDALMTITRLLVLLSRSDEPLSTVLDREAPLG